MKKGNDLSVGRDGMTIKQREWLNLYLETGNATAAAKKVYNVETIAAASTMGYQNVRKLDKHIRRLMEARGLTMGKLLDKLEEGLESNRVISATIIAGKEGKEATGTTTDFIEVPDMKTRHQYLKTAGDWYGIEDKEEKVEQTINQQLINVFIGNDGLAERLAGAFSRLDQGSDTSQTAKADS